MKHALDVAVMLDTMAHDPRLDLQYLIPAGDNSILDSIRPSFEQLDLEPASLDLIEWAASLLGSTARGVDNLKIPLFLVQLIVLKCSTMDSAVDMLVRLITGLDRPKSVSGADTGTRYLVLNLVSAAETKWPGIFQTVLEKIFSKAIAVHIADSEGSVNVEKILGNLAMLFEETVHSEDRFDARPGFNAFKLYITNHWKQVLLLFVNHPSIDCQVMGYHLLTNARFWEDEVGKVATVDPLVLSKSLMDSWFRHMKNQYIHFREDGENFVLDEIQHLIGRCCLNTTLAKTILCIALDGILDGALEIFPKTDAMVLTRTKMSILDKVRQDDMPKKQELFGKQPRPPQFVTMIDALIPELDTRDKIYINNIERTAALFYKSSLTSLEDSKAISLHVLSHLSSKWPRDVVSLDTYDDVLPKNIPYASDIAIGSAFKDHPVLFLIVEKCLSAARFPTSDIIRSILVYFIAFWHMAEVSTVSSALKYSTQLEETIRITVLLTSTLPESLLNARRLFPFMSGQDIGDILHQVIWPYVRSHPAPDIPGLSARTQEASRTDTELEAKCLKRLTSIYERRVKVLEVAPSWQEALQSVGAELHLGNKAS
ncbi:hypothetical protein DFQ28_010570 [Apophysomyces sp. BC1034]|nr:hypothetical protein DFQ29_002566 [Apophysomyces sp. BC1021]KAG0194486.1 hypothetical protein DFQ28_010570 [Apophysomyces sp. BC1034]